MVINYKKLNPNCFHLLKYLQDASLRFIILYGGSSSAKSFSIAQAILIMTLQDPGVSGFSWLVSFLLSV